jgi:diguanylate cyclase (GGDEF)-like protein/PAS domain S-box-containing protein
MNPARTAGDRLAQRVTGKLASLCKTFASGFGASIAIAAFGVLLVALLWGALFFKVRAEKAEEIRTVTKDTGNLARVFEEHVLRTIREADQVLLFIADQYRAQGRAIDLRRLMEDGPIISRIYTELGVFDARGDLVAATRPRGPTSFPDGEHSRVHRASDTGQLYIGKPALDQSSGNWSIQLSRRLNNPDLSFAGIAVVSIDPQAFSKLYSQTDLGEQAMITLVGRDGVVRARRSRNESNATVDTSRWTLFRMLPSSPSGSYISTGATDGLKRIFSFRSLTDYPLVVVVGAAETEALAEFHDRKRGYINAAGLGTLVVLGFTVFLLAMVRRLRRHNSKLGQALDANTQLAAIVHSSDDAIVSTTPEGAIRTWNAGAARLFGYSPDEAIGQPIALLYAAGEQPAARRNLEAIKEGKRHYEAARVRRDGSLVPVSVTAFPIQGPAGAIVGIGAIYRDISERKKADAAIKASETRLRAILDNDPECVALLSRQGGLMEINRAGLAMLEATTIEQVRKHGLPNFVRSEHRDCFTDCLGRGTGDAPADIEVEIIGLEGTRRWLQCRLAPMHLPETGGDSLLVVARDITEHKRNQERIEYLSHHDALTGLPNRDLFQDRLELAVAHARRRGEVLGILLANLDRFKKVNESLGHEAGDRLLQEVASRLKSSLREVDTIARLGGDDFAVLVEGAEAVDDVVAVAEKVIQTLAAPFEVQDHEVFVSASIGVASCVDGACHPGKLLECAEMATARAKRDGGGGYQVYQDEPLTLSGKRLTFESRLRRALENRELSAHYQPKIDLLTGTVTGAEALLRWNSPELGPVSPAQFIPIAEETGLIVPIGAWILEAACAQAARWQAAGHHLGIAVNLSPRQFRQKNLVSMVAEILARSGLAANHLELEITEGTAMSNVEQSETVLAELHQLGVKLAVDDFGTGYSSLSYLRRFPLHCLKIDRSFVRDAADDTDSAAIVRATIALAHSLRLKVVAEGIETDDQRALLLHAACDEGQGDLFSKPVAAEAFERLLESRRRTTRGAPAGIKVEL